MKKNAFAPDLPPQQREVLYETASKGRALRQSTVHVSKSVTHLLAYQPTEFKEDADLWMSLVHPDDRKELDTGWQQVVRTGKGVILQYRMRPKKSRDYIWVEDEAEARRDPDGKCTGVVGSVIDITERKRLETALEESEAHLRSIFDDAPIGMYRTTPQGRILAANKAILDMLGYADLEELLAGNLNDKEFERHYPRLDFQKRIERDGYVRGFESAWTGRDGRPVFVRESAHVVRDDEGNAIYYEGTVEDITERKVAEETTARFNRLMKMASEVGQLIIRESDQKALLAQVCKSILTGGGYLMAWIGFLDKENRKVNPIVWSGKERGYLNGTLITADDRPEGNGPAGKAIKSRMPSVCNDLETDILFQPWKDKALERGYRSAAAFPMRVRGTVVGLLTLYDGSKGRFTLEETHLVSEIADNIGFALWAIEARKQQEVADEIIKDREYWLKESQRVAKIGSYIYEIDSRSWSCSSALDELLGIDSSYRRDFRSWLNLIHPDDRVTLLSELRPYAKMRKQFSTEFRIVRAKDGEVRWMWGTAEFIRGPKGKPARLFGTVQDITERKLAEEALIQSENLFHTSFENSSIGIALLALDGKYRKVNSKFSEMVDYTKEELANLSCTDLTFPDDAAVADKVFADAVAGHPGVGTVEKRYVRKDGRVIWVEFSVSLVRNQKGQPDFLIANFNDVTERKQVEEAFKNEHILLRTLIDNLPNSIYVKDKNYRKTLANPANIRHTGMMKESDVLGKTDFDLYPRVLAEKYFEDDQRVIRDGQTILLTEEYSIGPNGEMRWQLTSKIPLRDKSGAIVGLIGIGTDITERKRAQENERRERILLKTLFDHLPASIWVKDLSYHRTAVNKAHISRTALFSGRPGLTEEDFIGKTDFNIYDEDKAREFFLDDQTVIRDGKTILDREELVTDSKGERHWQLVSKVPLVDQNGQITGLIGIVTDITRQKEAEEARERERILLRTIVESIPHPIYVKDKEYKKVLANPADIFYTGVKTEAEVIGKDDFELFPHEMAERFRADDERVILHGETVKNRVEYSVDADGKKHWMLASKVPLRDESGNIFGLVGNWTDITERVESEEALRASEAELRALFASMKDVVLVFDRDGKCLKAAGTGAADIFGPASSSWVGKSIADFMPEEETATILSTIRKALTTGELQNIRYGSGAQGTEVWFDANATPLTKDSVLWVARDVTDHRRAEETVRKERILLRTLIDNLPNLVYVKDRNYRKIIANQADVRMSGHTSEADIIGKTDMEVYPREVAERFYSNDKKVLEHGETLLNEEELLIAPDGKEHWLLTSKIPLHDQSGEVIGLVGVGTEVTDRREMEEALRRSEAELRALFESMNDVVMSIDSRGKFLKIAPTDPSLLYRPADEMTGKTFFDIFPSDVAGEFLKVVRNVLRDGETHTIEYTLQIAGEEKWRAASVSPMSEDSVIWVARDVTERKTMEKEITDSEKKYRELVENALVGVYKINLSGTVVYANKAMADMLEFESPQEMMSVSFSSLYRNLEDMGDLIDELRTFGKTGKNKEVEFVTKSGKVRNVLISASLDRDVISGMAKDITEIRTLEREFIQTQKLEGLGNIAAGIAHDFNNILGVILGYSDLLGQSSYEEKKFGRGMQAIAKSAERGKSLVRQLLTFARKTDVTFESVSLNHELADVERLIQETFPKTIEVHAHHEQALPPVLADATQIHQVLLNLCVNARDAMPGGGALSLTTRVVPGANVVQVHPEAAGERYVEVSVRDTGTGMDEATRQRIFEPFFTTKGVGKGTGLGLSVVYGIVESHRGFIDVESAPGKGTTFRIYLPVLEHPIEDEDLAGETCEAGEGASATVLVIEDEEMLRELLRSVLAARGHKVLLARDGVEGVETYRNNVDSIDMVISDLGLPKLGGEEVVRRIKAIDGHARVAVASGFISPEVKIELEKEGISCFVQKPYRTSEVVKVVSEMLLAEKR